MTETTINEKVIRKARFNTMLLAAFFGSTLAQCIYVSDLFGTVISTFVIIITVKDFNDINGVIKEINKNKKQ